MSRRLFRSLRRDRQVAAAIGSGLAITIVATALAGFGTWRWNTDQLEDVGKEVATDLGHFLDADLAQLRAVRGLFDASEEVTGDEFTRFARLLGPGPGIETVAVALWEPVGGEASGSGPAGRARRLVVGYEYRYGSHPSLLGTDLAADRRRRAVIYDLDTDGAARRVGEGPDLELLSPLGSGEGVALAVVDLDAALARPGFEVSVTPVSGEVPEVATPGRWVGTVSSPTGFWRVELTRPTPVAASALWPLTVLAVGGVLSLVAGGLVGFRSAHLRQLEETDRLRRLAREKDLFLASVSHELRTPLTGVVGLLSVLSQDFDRLSPDEVREYVDLGFREAQDLADLVEDLLTVGRLEAGALTYQARPIDAAEEVRRVVSRHRGEHPISVSATPVRVMADPLRVRQIVRNLVVNAIRHGKGRVGVLVFSDGDVCHIEVHSQGPPIPPEQVERIFEPYRSADRESWSPGSIGLGLYISRRMARDMGGDLTYRRVGEANVFVLSLPTAPVPVAAREELR